MSVYSLNFSSISALLVDGDRSAGKIATQILQGFGLARVRYCAGGEDAKRLMQQEAFELLLCEAKLPDLDAAEFVGWVRRLEGQNRFIPIVVLSGYTSLSTVNTVRDQGANCVVRKPMVPKVLLDHIEWAATSRQFVDTGNGYIGPDRRFKNSDANFMNGRRASDRRPESDPAAAQPISSDDAPKQTRVEVE